MDFKMHSTHHLQHVFQKKRDKTAISKASQLHLNYWEKKILQFSYFSLRDLVFGLWAIFLPQKLVLFCVCFFAQRKYENIIWFIWALCFTSRVEKKTQNLFKTVPIEQKNRFIEEKKILAEIEYNGDVEARYDILWNE